MADVLIIILLLFLIFYPVWILQKLARYGNGIFRPDFERMQREINSWTGFNQDGFSYNKPGGKLVYYLLLLYVSGGIIFIIYSLAS